LDSKKLFPKTEKEFQNPSRNQRRVLKQLSFVSNAPELVQINPFEGTGVRHLLSLVKMLVVQQRCHSGQNRALLHNASIGPAPPLAMVASSSKRINIITRSIHSQRQQDG